MATNDTPLSLIHNFKDYYMSLLPPDNFDRDLWDRLEILSVHANKSGKLVRANFAITVPSTYSNHNKLTHGGAIALFFDGISSSTLALISKKGYWDGKEVSRNLDIKFFRPVPLGEPLNAECEIVHVGQRLATIRGVITRASDGAVLASCQHEKFNPSAGGGSKL